MNNNEQEKEHTNAQLLQSTLEKQNFSNWNIHSRGATPKKSRLSYDAHVFHPREKPSMYSRPVALSQKTQVKEPIRMTLHSYIQNPDLPIQDPRKYKLPIELDRRFKKPPFIMHPLEEMDIAFTEISKYQKTRTDEELKTVKEYFQKHPLKFTHDESTSLPLIMEQLFSEKSKQEEIIRIKNLPLEAKKIYKKRIQALKNVMKKYQIPEKEQKDFSSLEKIQCIANDSPDLFHLYKKQRDRVFDKVLVEKEFKDEEILNSANSADSLKKILRTLKSDVILKAFQSNNLMEKIQMYLTGKGILKCLFHLKKQAKDEGNIITANLIQTKIAELKKQLKASKALSQRKSLLMKEKPSTTTMRSLSQSTKLDQSMLSMIDLKRASDQKLINRDLPIIEKMPKSKSQNRFHNGKILSNYQSQLLLPALNQQSQENLNKQSTQMSSIGINQSFQVQPYSVKQQQSFGFNNSNDSNYQSRILLKDILPQKVKFINKTTNNSPRNVIKKLNNSCQFIRDKRFESPRSPTIYELKEHISKYDESLKRKREMEKYSEFKSQVFRNIKNLQQNCQNYADRYKKEEFPIQKEYNYKLFTEDLQQDNYKSTLQILEQLNDTEDAKTMRILFYFLNNMRDEFNSQTRLLAQEVKTGMMDPKRDVALVEIQNFIKKNISKRLQHQSVADARIH